MKIKQLHKIDRPREKLLDIGPERLKNSELLAILINTGTSRKSALEIAEDILKSNTLTEFFDFSLETLLKIPGIEKAKAAKFLAVKEISDRVNKAKSSRIQLNDPKLAVALLNEFKNYRKEHLAVLYLNIHNELIWQETISVGILDATLIHPREIFEPAIRYNAAGIILAHNHPSGDPTPSEVDIKSTKNLCEAGSIMGIDIIDHIIIAKDNFVSMKQANMI